jgi:hypothetical protein
MKVTPERTWWRLLQKRNWWRLLQSVPVEGYSRNVPDEGYSRAYLLKVTPETYLMKVTPERTCWRLLQKRTWWRLLQKRVVCTIFDIYVYINPIWSEDTIDIFIIICLQLLSTYTFCHAWVKKSCSLLPPPIFVSQW